MDPVSIVVAALATGAASALRDTTAAAIKDAYAALKDRLQRRYSVDTSGVEKKPDSQVQQAAVKESLDDANAAEDVDLLTAARQLLQAVEKFDPSSEATAGLILNRIDAGSIDIERIAAAAGSTAVTAQDVKVVGAMRISDVAAGIPPSDHP
jgi:hypothetical protein